MGEGVWFPWLQRYGSNGEASGRARGRGRERPADRFVSPFLRPCSLPALLLYLRTRGTQGGCKLRRFGNWEHDACRFAKSPRDVGGHVRRRRLAPLACFQYVFSRRKMQGLPRRSRGTWAGENLDAWLHEPQLVHTFMLEILWYRSLEGHAAASPHVGRQWVLQTTWMLKSRILGLLSPWERTFGFNSPQVMSLDPPSGWRVIACLGSVEMGAQ